MKSKRRGELREATEGLVISLKIEIEETEEYLATLKQERSLLQKRLLEEETK